MGKENKGRLEGCEKRSKMVKELKCMFTDIRSIMYNNKFDELRYEMQEREIDVLGIEECWTTEKIAEAETKIQGYETLRKDRGNKRGGGVLMYVKEEE